MGKDLILSSLSVLLLRGPASPSLTLASAPLAREHRGPPIPARHWLPCWARCTGAPDDTAAQGWGLGPQLGARRRSPNTCRPVLDTVYASFCREYLNTCSSTRKMYQPMISSSAEAAATAAMVPSALGGWLSASAAEGRRFAEGRWSLGVRCWAHCCSRRGRALSSHPPPNCACAHGGVHKEG